MIHNYQTVISFGEENVEEIIKKYETLLNEQASVRIINAHLIGLAYGYTISVRFFYLGVIFLIGASFTDDLVNYKTVFISVYMILICTMGAGFALNSAPSVSRA